MATNSDHGPAHHNTKYIVQIAKTQKSRPTGRHTDIHTAHPEEEEEADTCSHSLVDQFSEILVSNLLDPATKVVELEQEQLST